MPALQQNIFRLRRKNMYCKGNAKEITMQNIAKCIDAICRVPSEHLNYLIAHETVMYLEVMLEYVKKGGAVSQ
jgi:hypothetical protein